MGRATVLVIQIICMLPYVEGKHWLEAFHDRIGRACLLGYHQGAVLVCGKPYPSGAEQAHALGCEFLLESIEAPPLGRNLPEQRRGHVGLGSPGSAKLSEIKVVVQHLSGVVEDGSGRASHDLFETQSFESGTGKKFVQVVHIGLQMPAVVDLQSLGADYGLKSIMGISKVKQIKHINLV